MDHLSLYLGRDVTEKTIEWNLAFAVDEVVAGVEKLCTKLGYSFSCMRTEEAAIFRATPPQGALTCTIRPLASHHSPFNIQVTLSRTLLLLSYVGLSPHQEEALKQQLTLTFLRVGG